MADEPVVTDAPVPRRSRGHRGAPLIPDFLWRFIGVIVGALAVVVGVLGVLTSGEVGPRPFEQKIIDRLLASDVPLRFWNFGRSFGAPAFFGAVVVALAIWAIARRSWPALVACATVPGAVVLVEQILKPLVDRRYIGPDTLYYPSATAAGVAAWTTLAWLLAIPMVRHAVPRLALTVAWLGLSALTAVSVVAAQQHMPLDAVGGMATGMGVVLSCAALIDLATGAHRRSDEADVAPAPVAVSRD